MPGADPTIPRAGYGAKSRSLAPGPSWGRLVDYGNRLVLVDHKGNDYPSDRLRIVDGSFGSDTDGVFHGPRPWKYGPGGEVLVQGDMFLIHFLDGDPQSPILQGGVRTLTPADTAFFPRQAIGEDPNPLRIRKAARNASTGAQTGGVELRILDGRNAMELTVGGAAFGTGLKLVVDFDAGTVKMGYTEALASNGVLLGPAYLAMENAVLTQLTLALDAIGALVNAGIPIPVPPVGAAILGNSTAIKAELAKVSVSQSADAPLMSSIVKVQ